MPKLVLRFEKYLDPERVFEILRERARSLSGVITRAGSEGEYNYMGNHVRVEVDPHGVTFSFLDSGIDPLMRPLESFARGVGEEYGRPEVGLGLPDDKKAVWAGRFRNLF